jgi:hypothetical protein
VDEHHVMLGMLKKQIELEKKLEETEQDRDAAREQAEALATWSKSIRPTCWDDVDDEWVARWTGFRYKAVAQAFFDW